MLLLGVLAAQAGAPAAAGSYDLLETEILTGSQTSITFTSGGVWANYQHLQLRYAGSGFTTYGNFALTFNGDTTTSNYYAHMIYASGTSAASYSDGANPYIGYQWSAGVTAGVVDILDFGSTTKYKTARGLIGNTVTGAGTIMLTSELWKNTNAVTSLTFSNNRQSLPATFRLSLYGLKAA